MYRLWWHAGSQIYLFIVYVVRYYYSDLSGFALFVVIECNARPPLCFNGIRRCPHSPVVFRQFVSPNELTVELKSSTCILRLHSVYRVNGMVPEKYHRSLRLVAEWQLYQYLIRSAVFPSDIGGKTKF